MRNSFVHLLLAVALGGIVGCTKKAPVETAQVKRSPQPVAKPAPGETLVEIPSEAMRKEQEFRALVEPWIRGRDYARLNALAADLRQSKAALGNGRWELLCFYSAISDLPDTADRLAWEERQARLQEWVQADPTSITASVGLADFWVSFAWKARGNGWANTVGEEGWRLMAIRLDHARKELERATALSEHCPVYYSTLQRVALSQGWSHQEHDALFQEAIKREPTFVSYWTLKANFLQKRWYGTSNDDWLKFITAEANRIGGEEGDMLYARVACYVRKLGSYDSFLKDSGADWPRIKNGLEACLRRQPDSLWAKSNLCYFSGQMGDRNRCKELFASIGSTVDLEIWGDSERFRQDRAWAFAP